MQPNGADMPEITASFRDPRRIRWRLWFRTPAALVLS